MNSCGVLVSRSLGSCIGRLYIVDVAVLCVRPSEVMLMWCVVVTKHTGPRAACVSR